LYKRIRVSSGISELDRLLGGLFIGDNVVWYDDSGSQASLFCLNFLQTSLAQRKSVIYASFDRSPKNLLERLGPFAESPDLTILDAFTCGRGECTPTFMKFYDKPDPKRLCRIKMLDKPHDTDYVKDVLYELLQTMEGDVRLIFESVTGMQKIWGGEDAIVKFYSHSCPRLYELNTVAYWTMEKLAHSPRLRAQIKQIAQVAIELSVKNGTTALMILKAENRDTKEMHKPHPYTIKDLTITFDHEKSQPGNFDIGLRVKELRIKRGLSQAEFAEVLGISRTTISQVEANIIYPSLPTLLKIAEVLSIHIGAFFQEAMGLEKRIIFTGAEAVSMGFPDMPNGSISGELLVPPDFESKMAPYLIEIEPGRELPAHFFVHKGEEMGYLLSGKLQMSLNRASYTVRSGDLIYLTSEMPGYWKNPGPNVARLFWIKSK
jgi:transcriptional regulator with XRE-family HTH domain/archaellum biogenesis ATPase FlaH